jgi:outer membrane protein OmpA-like peptidoglycan-associated protein
MFMNHWDLVRKGVLCAVAAAMVAGCMTTDPYTGDKKTSNTAKGAGIGALAGAAIGALTGDNSKERRKRALIGAGVGGLAGAGVGQYMDRQEAKLRQQLQGSGVSVTRQGDMLVLNMPGNITFQTGSADLNASFFGVLNSVALVLKEYDKTIIDVTGHTDSVGSDSTNMALSERRASSVASYLATQGVVSQRIATAGFGETRPVASNDTPEGRAQNRRVELTLTPITAS